MSMNSIKDSVPSNGTPVVWCAIERKSGHVQSGLTEWTDELETQLLDLAYDSYWITAWMPWRSRLKGAAEVTHRELTAAEIQVHELEDRLNSLEAMLEELEDVPTGDRVSESED